MADIQQISEQIRTKSLFVDRILREAGEVIVGQRTLLERLVMALLCDGHVLLEGLPGLAKTLTIKTLAHVIDVDCQRIQFTPDLMPADLVGTMIYNQKTGELIPKKGPVFTNIVIADEINRAPAKVQSALLEAMGEHQVTIGDATYKMADPFIVLATQNPIEQEGTYRLPEAQLDRFLFQLDVTYPSIHEEKAILDRMTAVQTPVAKKVCSAEEIREARGLCASLYMDDKVKDYILSLVFASRFPEQYGLKNAYIAYGASPRATLALAKASRAHAFLQHRGYVTPEDVKAVAYDVLRHRICISFDGEAEGMTASRVIDEMLRHIVVP